MTELTKEYFDSQLGNLATKDDLKPLATKKDVEKGVGELAGIIANTIAEPMERHFQEVKKELDVYAEVKVLKADMERIKEALHLSPSQA
jgi:hypothetical protein